MGHALIEEFLTGQSKEIRDLASNEPALVGFLTLIKAIDDLPNTSTRFYEKPRSLYQVTATGTAIQELMAILKDFFGVVAKGPDKNLPVGLRFDPTVKFLGGIRKDQALFLKKLKTGSFYGALWPWQRDKEKIEVLLGFYAASMSEADYSRMETLVQKFLSQKKLETLSEVGGQIHGISLPSFLQMSEMEGATYTLRVTSGNRTGYLHLDGGSLIAAQCGDQTGNEAAYRIISWDKAAIQIDAADPDREREIHEPLMHVMMESLKIKDERGAAPETPPPPPPQPEPELVLELESRAPIEMEIDAPPSEPIDVATVATLAERDAKASDDQVLQPAGKPQDQSIGKQDQMSRTTKLLIVLGAVIVFALVVTFGGKLLQQRQINRRYDQLIAELAVTKELDAQVVLLLQYINAYPNDAHRQELEARLKETTGEIEKRDYEKTVADVKQLPINEKYKDRALSLYTAFLSKHPQSPYAKEINQAIDSIGQIMGSASFEALKQLTTGDYMERYAAYDAYLERYPQSAKRSAVEGMIDDLAREYYEAIKKQGAACDEKEAWNACIAECDRFLSTFSEVVVAENVKALRSTFMDRQALAALADKVALVADDFAKAKKVYADYLANNPQTSQKATILERIDALNNEIARQAEWKKTAAFATNPANDINKRILRLDAFIDAHGSGPYAAPARALRERIEPEIQEAMQAQRAEELHRQALARRQAEETRAAEAARRIQRLRNQVAEQLVPVSGRYADNRNGTVTDRVTGLTWCLLDSQIELNRCITYDAAKAYVQGLRTAGYNDWRLPTAGELASLYKNSPFFPNTGAAWYWTSESFARGYHRVVDVVTSEPERVFKRLSKNEASCGAVRAVRR